MRCLPIISLIILISSPALAEEYGLQQPYPHQEARVDQYYANPYSVPMPTQPVQDHTYTPPTPPTQTQPAANGFGESFTGGDLRHMNF